MEFGDDLLGKASMNVPFCSMFSATTSTVDCGKVFGCSSDDSLWRSPTRLLCEEEGWLPLDGGTEAECDAGKGKCVYLKFSIVPFVMEVAAENSDIVSTSPIVSVAGTPTGIGPWRDKTSLSQNPACEQVLSTPPLLGRSAIGLHSR